MSNRRKRHKHLIMGSWFRYLRPKKGRWPKVDGLMTVCGLTPDTGVVVKRPPEDVDAFMFGPRRHRAGWCRACVQGSTAGDRGETEQDYADSAMDDYWHANADPFGRW